MAKKMNAGLAAFIAKKKTAKTPAKKVAKTSTKMPMKGKMMKKMK